MNRPAAGDTGTPIAPWLVAQSVELRRQRGHAWLLHGPSGLGQYELAMSLARSWLCDKPGEQGACGQCGSCHAIEVRTHADLCVLMPETLQIELGWPLHETAQKEIDDKKRKASKEIRVDAMRAAVEFSQRTSARGKGKAVLVYPAERMNAITANALLKTLEEPPGDVRFVLACEAVHQLLPTIRSRCLGHAMTWPQTDAAMAWLNACGVDAGDASVWLRASGGRPDDALALAQSGAAAKLWSELPRMLAKGDSKGLSDLPMPQVVGILQKLCHDLMAVQGGADPRFFEAKDLPDSPAIGVLSEWSVALARTARTAEHPFNAGLMLESLVSQAGTALKNSPKAQAKSRLATAAI